MPVKAKINKNWSATTLKGIQLGQLEMVTDVHRRSNMIAPVDTAAMVNSSIIRRLSAFIMSITYGSSRVPYARRQFFENRTKSQWLTKAAEGVVRGDVSKYFRGKI
jgi:hypothetical protein